VLEENTPLGTIKVRRGAVNKVEAVAGRLVAGTVPVEASDSVLTTQVTLEPSVRAPILAGQKLGEIELLEGGTRVAVFSVVAASDVEEGGWLSVFGIQDATAAVIKKIVRIVLTGAFILLAAYIVVKRREVRRKKQERTRQIQERRAREEVRRREWDEKYESRYWDDR
jgi:hypothetical protein